MDVLGYLKGVAESALNPKGNLGDARHADKTFVKNTYRLAPKTKFLYHVAFTFSPALRETLPTWDAKKHDLESGLLVKNAQLPTFTSNVETKKKYNRTKHIQTGITYNPVTINFHDDNQGIISGMLEAYYRYYFLDGNYDVKPEAYNKLYGARDSTYQNSKRNTDLFGYHRGVTNPFFTNIQMSQLTRQTYTTFTLVNPIITELGYGSVDASAGAETNELSITVSYETVWMERGGIQEGQIPKGFGQVPHYDYLPSPLSLAGGGTASFGAVLSGGVDLFDYATTGQGFKNPLQAALAGINLARNVQNLDPNSLGQELQGFAEGTAADFIENSVSGVPNAQFPSL